MARTLEEIRNDIAEHENVIEKFRKLIDSQKENRQANKAIVSWCEMAINAQERIDRSGLRTLQTEIDGSPIDIYEQRNKIWTAQEEINRLDAEIPKNEAQLSSYEKKLKELRFEERNPEGYQADMAEAARKEEEERIRREKYEQERNSQKYQELINNLPGITEKPLNDNASSSEYTARIADLDRIEREFRNLPVSFNVTPYIQKCETCRGQCKDAITRIEKRELRRKKARDAVKACAVAAGVIGLCAILGVILGPILGPSLGAPNADEAAVVFAIFGGVIGAIIAVGLFFGVIGGIIGGAILFVIPIAIFVSDKDIGSGILFYAIENAIVGAIIGAILVAIFGVIDKAAGLEGTNKAVMRIVIMVIAAILALVWPFISKIEKEKSAPASAGTQAAAQEAAPSAPRETPQPEPANTGNPRMMITTDDRRMPWKSDLGRYERLSLRSEPGGKKILAQMERGEIVTVLETGYSARDRDGFSGNWLKVQYGGMTGWCFSAYLDPAD